MIKKCAHLYIIYKINLPIIYMYLFTVSIIIIIIIITFITFRIKEGMKCDKNYLFFHPPIRDKLKRKGKKIECHDTEFPHYFTYS